MNNISLIGRLTKDIDLRYTASGVAVGTFTLAVNRAFKNAAGETEADFIQCVIWKKGAETLANYTQKGSQLGINGRIQTRTYDNQQGQKVYVTEVVVDHFYFLEKKGSQAGGGNQSQPQRPRQQDNGFYARDEFNRHPDPFQHGESINIGDSDLPF